jgi:hypothetical protein
MPEQNEVENFWWEFAEKVKKIRDEKLGKRLKEMYEFLEQKKDLEALGKIVTTGTVLFQKEADRIIDEEIEKAEMANDGFTLEGHLRSERDGLRRQAESERDSLKRQAKLTADYPAVEAKILEIASLIGDPDGEFAEELRDECAERQEETETEEGQKKTGE